MKVYSTPQSGRTHAHGTPPQPRSCSLSDWASSTLDQAEIESASQARNSGLAAVGYGLTGAAAGGLAWAATQAQYMTPVVSDKTSIVTDILSRTSDWLPQVFQKAPPAENATAKWLGSNLSWATVAVFGLVGAYAVYRTAQSIGEARAAAQAGQDLKVARQHLEQKWRNQPHHIPASETELSTAG
ncbi:MAG: hypothetical protein KC910_36860, partial [Candidatus Eremiobacteraeota bacterium]|nr:hypothetical protein [Candidatus Eremiobacteraeota bacterium]